MEFRQYGCDMIKKKSSSLATVRPHFGQSAVDLEMRMADHQEYYYKSQVVR